MLTVKTRINHDGRMYEPGDTMDGLSEDQEKSLLESGSAVAYEEPKKVSKSDARRMKAQASESSEDDPMAGVTPDSSWKKPRIMGYLRSKGVEFDETEGRNALLKLARETAKSDSPTSGEGTEGDEEGRGGDGVGGAQPPVSTDTPEPGK